jgi:hypothetical protein
MAERHRAQPGAPSGAAMHDALEPAGAGKFNCETDGPAPGRAAAGQAEK